MCIHTCRRCYARRYGTNKGETCFYIGGSINHPRNYWSCCSNDHSDIDVKLQKKQLETQIKANYSLVQQAIKFAEYDDVSYDMAIQDGSDASIQEWYDSFLSKHLKVEQFCSNAKSGCWHKKGIVKDLLGNAPRYEYDNGIGGNIVNFKLANGAFFNVDGNTAEDMKSFGIDSTSDGLTFYFDANGDKKPNQFGKDIYIMVWTDKGLVPAGYNRTKAEVDANCLRGDGYFCLQKVISEGWQISDEVWKRH